MICYKNKVILIRIILYLQKYYVQKKIVLAMLAR